MSLIDSPKKILSCVLIAIIIGFIASAAFLFFKAIFGTESAISKDFTAAFMGAFFAFLFLRIGEALTLIYKRHATNRNALVKIQHHLNDCLNLINDNMFIIGTFFSIFKNYSDQEESRIFSNRLKFIPIEKDLVVDLMNIDMINEIYTLHVDFRKLNDSMETANNMITGASEAFIGKIINHTTYVANIDQLKPRMEDLKKFLHAACKDIIEALASSNLLLKNEPFLSTIIRLTSSKHYSQSHKKALPDEIKRVDRQIEEIGKESDIRIRKIKSEY